ncbi:hypothetical protein [Terrisporobacter glycolicus]|uniref:Uncharacterized protein n=1 Tax=Terrisporobacter glycolicus ATCC 14880 = DSM 1288 TaxID=1121315 RepID=A0ABZ2EUE2_9FIRM|nr:hypothetical protein [Terrisporobacter glycolicus]
MSRKKYKSSCKSLADQYLTLVTIYAAIINQQFDDADELEIFAEFLVALGEELALAAAIRGRCEANSEGDFEVDVDESTITSFVDGFQRAYKGKNNKFKK